MGFRFNLKYLLLFAPWVLASIYDGYPIFSYFIAWFGSFLIFYLSMNAKIIDHPKDLTRAEQFMRPVFMVQLIFAGYMAISSIFFLLDVLGFEYFTFREFSLVNNRDLLLVAKCQRFYVLGHAAYVAGLLLFSRAYQPHDWKLNWSGPLASFFIKASIVAIVASLGFSFIPGLDQFSIKFKDLSYISAILSFAYAIKEKRRNNLFLAGGLFTINFLAAFFSGWKEPIIVTIIVLGGYLYPIYRRAVLILIAPIFFAIIIVLPTYNALYREQSWEGGLENEQAAQMAFEAIQSGEIDLASANWLFLTNRFSEISMFVEYVDKVPAKFDYYGLKIYTDALYFLIPRLFWPDKPDVEKHVMERVYNLGVINSLNNVSAKPPLIVDAYLTGGGFYIGILLFIMGCLTSWLCHACENLFAGYTLGTAWVFAGVFQILWRGNSMEFLFNSVFWGIITMYFISFVLRRMNILIPK